MVDLTLPTQISLRFLVGEVWWSSVSSPLPWCLGEGDAFFCPQGGLWTLFPRRASVYSFMAVSFV